MLFVESVFVFLQFGVAFGIILKYPFKAKNACYQQHNDVISDDVDVTSLSTCLAICAQNGCCSLFFNEESKRCVTYHVVKLIMVPECGWKYAEIDEDRCSVGKPYTPQYPLKCDHGYSYDAETNKCVKYCSAYGSTFGTFSGFYIRSFNNVNKGVTSIQNCSFSSMYYALCHLNDIERRMRDEIRRHRLGICMKNGCCSLLFDTEFQRCITYHVIKTTLVPGCAWKYAEIGLDSCQDPTPYIPTSPNTCALGYSYDPSDNKCVLECAEYGTTFGTFNGFYIPSLNNAIMSLGEYEECKVACLEADTFFCRTADMNSAGVCYMSVVTKPSGSYGVDSAFIMWQRNCA